MKRILEITASFTGTISKGAYENEKPLFALKETIDLQEDEGLQWSDVDVADRQKQLQEICRNQFRKQEDASLVERIAKEYQNIRFYDISDSVKYPSVTSIIGWDKDFHMSKEDLQQHASRGNIIDKQVEIFLSTGEWKEPKDIPEIYPDLVIVKRGGLGLEIGNVDFQAFYEKYPFKVINQQQIVINHEHRYAGRREILCVIEREKKGAWEKIDGVLFDVPTLLDIKATSSLDKTYVMKQCTAYAKCDLSIKQIGAIHLTKNNKCGYARPVIESDLNKYWSLFLSDRKNFNKRFGV